MKKQRKRMFTKNQEGSTDEGVAEWMKDRQTDPMMKQVKERIYGRKNHEGGAGSRRIKNIGQIFRQIKGWNESKKVKGRKNLEEATQAEKNCKEPRRDYWQRGYLYKDRMWTQGWTTVQWYESFHTVTQDSDKHTCESHATGVYTPLYFYIL